MGCIVSGQSELRSEICLKTTDEPEPPHKNQGQIVQIDTPAVCSPELDSKMCRWTTCYKTDQKLEVGMEASPVVLEGTMQTDRTVLS